MSVALKWATLPLLLLALPAWGQYEQPEKKAAPAATGLPPFLAKMQRHDVNVRVVRQLAEGQAEAVGQGTLVGVRILAGGAKVKEYFGETNAEGIAHFAAIPSNPEVQSAISYELWADHQGVRFPFDLEGVPGDGAIVELSVRDAHADISALELEHSFIELFPDEDQLVARHQMKLFNRSEQVIDPSTLPGGGLQLPIPEGGKHPSLHDENDPTLEARGTDIVVKGALLPASQSGPLLINIVYSIPYDTQRFEWNQALPIPVTGAMVVAPKNRQEGHQRAVPLDLETRGGLGELADRELDGGKRFEILRVTGRLAAGEPLRFAVSGLPAQSNIGLYAVAGGILGVLLFLLFGFREEGRTLSRTHLVNERDKLARALARMRKARDKGRISERRYEREREAITARLVSLYKALDRLDAASAKSGR